MKNPVSDNWYADPESRVYGDSVYMYVTKSLPFKEQLNLDLVITSDLEKYETISDILDMSTYKGVHSCVWAPTVIDKDNKYYIIFAANNILNEEQVGGLYIGVCDNPCGPFKNVFDDGRPLVNKIYNRAQPIDAHFFKDDDGTIYLLYGGWGHLMVCVMNKTMDGFMPVPEPCFDGIAKEITPKDYVEAPYVMKIDSKYHLMYSTGEWSNGTYMAKAGISENIFDGFEFYDNILKPSKLADGPGHNSAFYFKGQHYIAYHRRIIGDDNVNHRRLCVDKLDIENGKIKPVTMT